MKPILFAAVLVALAPVGAHAVTLKCTTSVTGAGIEQTQGTVYIDLEPNDYQPSMTNFKVVSVSNGHNSFAGSLLCGNVECFAVSTTDTKYVLANISRPDYYLSIVIDRTNGSYLGQQGRGSPNILGQMVWNRATENGNCAPGDVPTTLF